MKNKISFTSVLKSKGSRQPNLSSTETQHRQPRLVDLYQEFQLNPNKNYTLQLSAFRTMAYKSRNSSIGMMKSNHTNEDPELNLDEWVEQTRQNYQSITRGSTQKSLKGNLPFQQESFQSRRSQSNFNKNQIYPEQEEQQIPYQTNQILENSNRYEQSQMQESKKNYPRNVQKPSVHYHSQQIQEVQPDRALKPKTQNQQNKPMRPEEFLVSEQLRPKSHFPSIQDQDYKKLQEEFERLKSEKIAQLCMQTKKSVKKEKLQEIISNALENIYEDIEEMAQQIIMKRKMSNNEPKKNPSQEEVSEEMLISGCNDYEAQHELNQSRESESNIGDQRRKQEMRNMIKDYISGIQEAKSQGKASTSFHSSKGVDKNQSQNREASNASSKTNNHEEDSQEPSFNFNSNTFSNQPDAHDHSQKHQDSFAERKPTAKASIPESVGYSFANSNMICEHSFNKELMDHNFQNQFNFSQSGHFQKNHIKPAVYEPQNSDTEEEQRISLPNIEQVKSDCGDFMHEQLESSEDIQFKRNKMQNVTLDITGNNIKNIQSVHYEPPTIQFGYHAYQQQSQRKELFKNFEKTQFQQRESDYKKFTNHSRKDSKFIQKDEILKEQVIPSHQDQKFVSKTFSSYLSGQMRPEYGQAVKDVQKSSNDSSFSSKQSGFGYKIESINRYSPSVNKAQDDKIPSISMPSNHKGTFPSISSAREHNLGMMTNENRNQTLVSSKVNSSRRMNESSQMSLNNSMNQQSARQEGVSPKNIHQLYSKTKFSINSPMNKIDEILSIEQKQKRGTSVTEFNGFGEKTEACHQFTKPLTSSSYAISSPILKYETRNSTENIPVQAAQNMQIDRKYACAQSIASRVDDSLNQPFKDQQNSLLSMQPLKLSNENSTKMDKILTLSIQTPNSTSYPGHKFTQTHQINQGKIETQQIQTFGRQMVSSNISNGKTFLQSLHEKRSIQIEMSPENTKQVPQQKASFVAETFRPTMNTVQQHIKPIPTSNNDSQTISSNHKTSITKITLRSSDKNNLTSPKVISLSINQFPTKNQNIKQPQTNTENKENVFEKLTIKESKNWETLTDKQLTSPSSNTYQSIKITQTANIQNHVDVNSKENNNTMNNCTKASETKAQFSAYQKPKTAMGTEKREPLLKLSKNFGNSTTQQSINVKKSIGESIKTKVHPISSMGSSKGISMAANVKQSIKNVKQSIGNDSDMDFDLELD